MGANQYFFRTLMNSQNSAIMRSLPMFPVGVIKETLLKMPLVSTRKQVPAKRNALLIADDMRYA